MKRIALDINERNILFQILKEGDDRDSVIRRLQSLNAGEDFGPIIARLMTKVSQIEDMGTVIADVRSQAILLPGEYYIYIG